MTLRDSIKVISPPFLQAMNGEIVMYDQGVVLDALLEMLQQGVKARMPGVGTPSALYQIGRDRQLDRFPAESDAAYAARLRLAFDTWAVAGNAASILNQIAGYLGNPSAPALIRLVTNSGVWYTWQNGAVSVYRATPNNWNWDNDSVHWWRFWIIIQGVYTTGHTYGDGTLYGQSVSAYGTSATTDQIAGIKAIIQKWKPAHSYCKQLIVSLASGFLPPTDPPGSANLPNGTWGNASKVVGGVQLAARDARGRYCGPVY